MAEQDRTASIMPLLLAFTVIGGVSGTLYLHEPFESSRPKEAKSNIFQTTATELVPARAWQDPFSAVARCREEQATDKKNKCRSIVTDPKWPPSIPAEDRNKLLIMPVMVYGGAYSEDVETRRRRRYAVLSAMAMQDYRLSDAENIGYFTFPGNGKPSYVVPYEWLQHNTTHDDPDPKQVKPPILLLWLDEQKFGHNPLSNIEKLLSSVEEKIKCPEPADNCDAVHPERELNTTVTLIGPAGSAMLSRMIEEAHDMASNTNARTATEGTGQDNNQDGSVFKFKSWNFSIFSPTATASAKLLLGQTEERVRKLLSVEKNQKCKDIIACKTRYNGNNDFTSIFLIEKVFSKINIQFFRTISSDQTLAKLLVDSEFKNRNINVSSDDHIVVLISEWDTMYGRALPNVFERKISEKVLEQQKQMLNQEERKGLDQRIKNGIRTYYYMRGLDGEIINVDDNAKDSGSSIKTNVKTVDTRVRGLERAVGVNRFDYLRRLSDKIKLDLDKEAGKVGAIGVLGSDVYDKLLVLQALRSEFPKALFFTTDADMRFVHPAEFKWTRDLIVLSGYDIKLDETGILRVFSSADFESDVRLSSFRDSYQTAIFLATRLAVSKFLRSQQEYGHSDNIDAVTKYREELAEYLSIPKVFEVGRSGFLVLGESPRSLTQWLNDLNNEMWIIYSAMLFVLLVYSMFVFFDARVGRAILILISTGLLPVMITYAIFRLDNTSGEPIRLLSGANSLPTIAILLFTGLSAAFFTYKVYKDLRKNREDLTDYFKFNEEIENPLPPHDSYEIWWGRDFTLGLMKLQTGLEVDGVWKLYQRAADNVIWRSFFLAVLHTVLAMTFMYFLDEPRPPIRGENTLSAYNISLGFALFFFFWFLYIVVDQMRLCRVLARLSAKTTLEWSDLTLVEFAKDRGIELDNSNTEAEYRPKWNKDSLSKWLSIQLLADRTQVIDKSLYYPFIILLMLIIAHNTFFDNWLIVPSMIVIIVTSILIIVIWDIMLRGSAKAARETALGHMQFSLSQSLRLTNDNGEVTQLELLIDEVKRERRGAFRSFASDPILKAILMPSGGFGGLFLLEYLAR